MCGRYSLAASGDHLADRFSAVSRIGGWSGRFNCKPTMRLPIVRLQGNVRELEYASWGWNRQFGEKKAFLINAVGEEAPTKRTWAAAFRSRRCLVPITSYFEWVPKAAKVPARPFVFARKDRAIAAVAGLWEVVDLPEGPELRYILLTMAANPVVAPVHHRMAALLEKRDEATWLDPAATPEQLERVLRALPEDALDAWEVGRDVSFTGAKAVEGPQLLLPLHGASASPSRN